MPIKTILIPLTEKCVFMIHIIKSVNDAYHEVFVMMLCTFYGPINPYLCG